MLSNIFFALFGPSLTFGLKSLQFIQELSHVVLQLVHNIVGSELPVEGSLFQVQGAIGKATLIRCHFEKKADMWL